MRKAKPTKRLHNYLVYQQIHLPHGKIIKIKSFRLFSKGGQKRVKVDTYDQVNKAVLKWFKKLRSENVPVNGVLIQEKVLYFAKELTYENFQALDGWLDKRNKQLGLIFLFQTLLLYNYSNLEQLSLRILMNFSSAVNNNRDGTFIPNPSF